MILRSSLALILTATLACHATSTKPIKVQGSTNLQPTTQQRMVCKVVSELISDYSFKKVALNDSLSAVIFDRYLKSLDGNHTYFLASDIAEFNKYRTLLDDDIKEGNLTDVFYIFNVFQKRYEERINYSLAEIDKTFDFSKEESFTYDREKLPFAASVNELNDDWSKRIKYDMLNLSLASTDLAKNREKLKQRYQTLLKQSDQLDADDVFQTFMDAFTESIDPHTNYFNPSNAANFVLEMTRQLEGIGCTLQSRNEYVTIATVTPGGPAEKSHNINPGDRIIAVAQGKDGEFQDVIGWRVDNAVKLIRGTKGTLVRIKILPQGKAAGDKTVIVDLIREKIVSQQLLVKEEIKTYNNNGKTVKIGIINVPAFYSDYNGLRNGDVNSHSTSRDVKLILDTMKAKGVDGVVLDIRQNGGGSLNEAIALTGLFIKTGPVVQVKELDNKIEVATDDDPTIAWNGPVAVLVDRFSASASEIFAGALQDYGRALVIGTQTYGKGSVQNQIELDKVITPSLFERLSALIKGDDPSNNKTVTVDGKKVKIAKTGAESMYGQLNLTISKFYRVTGNSTQHKGVTPDIQFPSAIPLDKFGEDTEPSAMPFDRIPKSQFTKVGDFKTVVAQLTKLHEQRMSRNLAYKAMLADISDYNKTDSARSVTLNEVELKKKRDSEERTSFDRDNQRRIALGLQPIKKGEPRPKNEDLDFLKIEAGQILTDYISVDGKIATVNKRTLLQGND